MSAKTESTHYLSGFCSGGAEWAHDRCPNDWRGKPCGCPCHRAPEAPEVEAVMPGAGPCAICQDPEDHGGLPHGEVTGDGRQRESPRPVVELDL